MQCKNTRIRNPLTGKMTSVLNGNRFEYIVPVRTLPGVSYCAKIAIMVKTKLNRKLNVKTAWNTVTMRAIAKTTNDAKCARKLVMSPVRKNASNTRKIVRMLLLSTVIKICCQILSPLTLTLTVEIINLQSTRSSWQRHCATVTSMLLSVTEVWIRHSTLNVSAIQSTHSAWETEKVEVMTIVVEAKLNQVKIFEIK